MNISNNELAARYQTLRPELVAAVCALTGDLDTAEDCADEAFARAVVHWPRVQKMDSPNGWIYRVAINVAKRKHRRRRIELRLLRRVPAPVSIEPDEAFRFWLLIRDLPERQRLAIALRYVGQMTEHEIADVMKVKRGTVSATLRAAHERLRVSLSDGETAGRPV